MLRDYTLPAKTEFARGLESHLAASLTFLWSMRQPTASQTNAVKYFRHHLNHLPNNVAEFDASFFYAYLYFFLFSTNYSCINLKTIYTDHGTKRWFDHIWLNLRTPVLFLRDSSPPPVIYTSLVHLKYCKFSVKLSRFFNSI